MNPSDKISIPAHVMARQVGGETVILDLGSGTYFGLDPVGARIWALLSGGKTLGETREAMLGEYAVEPERLDQDLARLLGELIERGLAVPGH